MAAGKASYRNLLRLSRSLDRDPSKLTTLLCKPPKFYDVQQHRDVSVVLKMPFVNDMIYEACGRSTEFAHPVGGVAAAARKHRRLVEVMGLDYTKQAAEVQKRFDNAQQILAELRKEEGPAAEACSSEAGAGLSSTTAQSSSSSSRPSRLRRLAPDDPEDVRVGDLLLAHPLACVGDKWFDQAVIVITHVDIERDHIMGLVLNKTCSTLRQVVNSVYTPGSDLRSEELDQQEGGSFMDVRWLDDLGQLVDRPLHIGGPVLSGLQDSLFLLFRHTEKVGNATLVADQTWCETIGLGNDDTAHLNGLAPTVGLDSVNVYAGNAGWAMPQLAVELQRGVWVRGRLDNGSQDTTSAAESFSMEVLLGLGMSAEEREDALWPRLMRLLGMDVLCHLPRGTQSSDARLVKYLNAHYRGLT